MLLVMVLMSMLMKAWWPEKTVYVRMSCMCMSAVWSAACMLVWGFWMWIGLVGTGAGVVGFLFFVGVDGNAHLAQKCMA